MCAFCGKTGSFCKPMKALSEDQICLVELRGLFHKETVTPFCALKCIITWVNLVRCLSQRKSNAALCFKTILSLAENTLPQRLCSLEEHEFLFECTHSHMLPGKAPSPNPPTRLLSEAAWGVLGAV